MWRIYTRRTSRIYTGDAFVMYHHKRVADVGTHIAGNITLNLLHYTLFGVFMLDAP